MTAPVERPTLRQLEALVRLIHSSHMKIGDRWVPVYNWKIAAGPPGDVNEPPRMQP